MGLVAMVASSAYLKWHFSSTPTVWNDSTVHTFDSYALSNLGHQNILAKDLTVQYQSISINQLTPYVKSKNIWLSFIFLVIFEQKYFLIDRFNEL